MRTPQDYDLNINSLKDKMYNSSRKKITCYITVTFFYGRQKEVVMEMSKVTDADQITEYLKGESPDKIRIDYFKGKDATKYANFKIFNYEPQSNTVQMAVPQFQGLGEVEINNLVDQRFREQQQKEEFARLQEEVTELTAELDEQRELVEQLETENEQLQTELESKSQIRYYAGMLGDVLEGIGISKDKIRKPIASLMGIGDEEKTEEKLAPTNKQVDTSGIIEDVAEEIVSPEDEKRNEIITLMSDYLKNTDNQTLANVFSIFSEIEHNPALAIAIIAHIESQKTE